MLFKGKRPFNCKMMLFSTGPMWLLLQRSETLKVPAQDLIAKEQSLGIWLRHDFDINNKRIPYAIVNSCSINCKTLSSMYRKSWLLTYYLPHGHRSLCGGTHFQSSYSMTWAVAMLLVHLVPPSKAYSDYTENPPFQALFSPGFCYLQMGPGWSLPMPSIHSILHLNYTTSSVSGQVRIWTD